jgi:hypothetical protein
MLVVILQLKVTLAQMGLAHQVVVLADLLKQEIQTAQVMVETVQVVIQFGVQLLVLVKILVALIILLVVGQVMQEVAHYPGD